MSNYLGSKFCWLNTLMTHILISIIVLVILNIDNKSTLTDASFRRNAEPLNINWLWSLPWDVSNTLRAPLGGPASLILTGCLSVILFFGMFVSPVYYLLGTPPRKYHVHDSIVNRIESWESRGLKNVSLAENKKRHDLPVDQDQDQDKDKDQQDEEGTYPDFSDSLFWLIGEDDVNCRKLMICHAHGFFNFLPTSFFTYYRFFSRKMVAIPSEFQEAIMIGLEDQSLCMPTYPNCPSDLMTIVKKTFSRIVPTDLSPWSKYVGMLQNWLYDENE